MLRNFKRNLRMFLDIQELRIICQAKLELQASPPAQAKRSMTKNTEEGKSQDKVETHQTTEGKAGAKAEQGSVINAMR